MKNKELIEILMNMDLDKDITIGDASLRLSVSSRDIKDEGNRITIFK